MKTYNAVGYSLIVMHVLGAGLVAPPAWGFLGGEWLPVTASFSASLQNNHHHFPHFLRTSHADDEYDFGLMTVRVMKRIGLVKASPSGAQLPDGVQLTEIGF